MQASKLSQRTQQWNDDLVNLEQPSLKLHKQRSKMAALRTVSNEFQEEHVSLPARNSGGLRMQVKEGSDGTLNIMTLSAKETGDFIPRAADQLTIKTSLMKGHAAKGRRSD